MKNGQIVVISKMYVILVNIRQLKVEIFKSYQQKAQHVR